MTQPHDQTNQAPAGAWETLNEARQSAVLHAINDMRFALEAAGEQLDDSSYAANRTQTSYAGRITDR
jgi:hypothetical protein